MNNYFLRCRNSFAPLFYIVTYCWLSTVIYIVKRLLIFIFYRYISKFSKGVFLKAIC